MSNTRHFFAVFLQTFFKPKLRLIKVLPNYWNCRTNKMGETNINHQTPTSPPPPPPPPPSPPLTLFSTTHSLTINLWNIVVWLDAPFLTVWDWRRRKAVGERRSLTKWLNQSRWFFVVQPLASPGSALQLKHFCSMYLADPGKAGGCSTNISVIN